MVRRQDEAPSTTHDPKTPTPASGVETLSEAKLAADILEGLRQAPLPDDPPPLPIRRTRRGLIVAVRSAVRIKQVEPGNPALLADHGAAGAESVSDLKATTVRPAFVAPHAAPPPPVIKTARRRKRWPLIVCLLVAGVMGAAAVRESPLGRNPAIRGVEEGARRAAWTIARELSSLFRSSGR